MFFIYWPLDKPWFSRDAFPFVKEKNGGDLSKSKILKVEISDQIFVATVAFNYEVLVWHLAQRVMAYHPSLFFFQQAGVFFVVKRENINQPISLTTCPPLTSFVTTTTIPRNPSKHIKTTYLNRSNSWSSWSTELLLVSSIVVKLR